MWNKRRITPYVRSSRPYDVCSREMIVTELYRPSQIDDFLIQKLKAPNDTCDSVRLTSDIYMLFNQQRLDRMTQQALIQYFDDMQVREPKLAALRSKLTDEQLCQFVKSRYIQSPSELMAWSSYLMSNFDSEMLAAANVEPTPSPTPEPDPTPTE